MVVVVLVGRERGGAAGWEKAGWWFDWLGGRERDGLMVVVVVVLVGREQDSWMVALLVRRELDGGLTGWEGESGTAGWW